MKIIDKIAVPICISKLVNHSNMGVDLTKNEILLIQHGLDLIIDDSQSVIKRVSSDHNGIFSQDNRESLISYYEKRQKSVNELRAKLEEHGASMASKTDIPS